MEKTAVEWLEEQIKWRTNISDIIIQAKEMEKEQAERMYSEEEVKSAFKIGFNIGYGSPVQDLDLKNEHCEKWFESYKKK